MNDKHTIEVLTEAFEILQRHTGKCVGDENRKRRRRKPDFGYQRSAIQEKHGSYPFVSNHVYTVLPQLIHAFDYLEGKKGRCLSFLDAGCGIGNIMVLAEAVGFATHGLEFDPVTVKFAKRFSPLWRGIKKQNILTYRNYGKFDVVYYFCPLACDKEIKFEKRVEDQMKVGALLIAHLKRSREILRDKRFRKLKLGRKCSAIFEKIKK